MAGIRSQIKKNRQAESMLNFAETVDYEGPLASSAPSTVTTLPVPPSMA